MPRPPVSLPSFLAQAKHALHDAIRNRLPITFVIGNESADLDSLCSAVILAYLRSQSSPAGSLYIPLSNLPRADLDIRPELIPVLSHANLQPSDLLTLSDLPPLRAIASKLPPENTRWILVDHNAMRGELSKIYGKRLVGCVDHHAEENAVPKDCGDEPRIVKKCGSCTTLVVEYCKDAWNKLAKESHEDVDGFSRELAQVALGPILIDTSNLGNKAETTSTDSDVVDYLESWIKSQPGSKYGRDAYYNIVSEAKQDIGGLSLPDILRKDYKQYGEEGSIVLGIASAVRGMQFLIDKAGSKEKFVEVLEEFAKERGLSILSLMTKTTVQDGFARELLVWSIDEKGIVAARKFEADSTETLDLKEWEKGSLDIDDKGRWLRCWWQERVENSRKQVAPLMRAAIGDVE
ncbi:exopolyphosphatase [Hyphodiscus hymeniophilus]|uniref:Exopolyphosphatase n=1 Tax=Hyphodiscus hymeniophilus TaxID=353542 RepID=A0A9P6VQX0_9HELO|nr:exopolyphosphatase [Hyphodiscus hymeniophilus]